MARQQKITKVRSISVTATGVILSSTPCQISTLIVANRSASTPLYLKVYDKATAATEADTPVFTIPLPPADEAPSTFTIEFPRGCEPGFDNGLGVRAVSEVADNGTTGAGANEVIVNGTVFENLLVDLPASD